MKIELTLFCFTNVFYNVVFVDVCSLELTGEFVDGYFDAFVAAFPTIIKP